MVIRKRNEQSKSLVLWKAGCKFRKFFDTNKGIRKKINMKMVLANHNLLNRQAQKEKDPMGNESFRVFRGFESLEIMITSALR